MRKASFFFFLSFAFFAMPSLANPAHAKSILPAKTVQLVKTGETASAQSVTTCITAQSGSGCTATTTNATTTTYVIPAAAAPKSLAQALPQSGQYFSLNSIPLFFSQLGNDVSGTWQTLFGGNLNEGTIGTYASGGNCPTCAFSGTVSPDFSIPPTVSLQTPQRIQGTQTIYAGNSSGNASGQSGQSSYSGPGFVTGNTIAFTPIPTGTSGTGNAGGSGAGAGTGGSAGTQGAFPGYSGSLGGYRGGDAAAGAGSGRTAPAESFSAGSIGTQALNAPSMQISPSSAAAATPGRGSLPATLDSSLSAEKPFVPSEIPSGPGRPAAGLPENSADVPLVFEPSSATPPPAPKAPADNPSRTEAANSPNNLPAPALELPVALIPSTPQSVPPKTETVSLDKSSTPAENPLSPTPIPETMSRLAGGTGTDDSPALRPPEMTISMNPGNAPSETPKISVLPLNNLKEAKAYLFDKAPGLPDQASGQITIDIKTPDGVAPDAKASPGESYTNLFDKGSTTQVINWTWTDASGVEHKATQDIIFDATGKILHNETYENNNEITPDGTMILKPTKRLGAGDAQDPNNPSGAVCQCPNAGSGAAGAVFLAQADSSCQCPLFPSGVPASSLAADPALSSADSSTADSSLYASSSDAPLIFTSGEDLGSIGNGFSDAIPAYDSYSSYNALPADQLSAGSSGLSDSSLSDTGNLDGSASLDVSGTSAPYDTSLSSGSGSSFFDSMPAYQSEFPNPFDSYDFNSSASSDSGSLWSGGVSNGLTGGGYSGFDGTLGNSSLQSTGSGIYDSSLANTSSDSYQPSYYDASCPIGGYDLSTGTC